MHRITDLGRWLFAFSTVVLGIQQFVFTGSTAGLELVPSGCRDTRSSPTLAAFGFFAASVAIANMKYVRLEGLLGLMFLLWIVLLHAPRVAAHLDDENKWNNAFVALAMSGLSFVAAGTLEGVAKRMVAEGIGSQHRWTGA